MCNTYLLLDLINFPRYFKYTKNIFFIILCLNYDASMTETFLLTLITFLIKACAWWKVCTLYNYCKPFFYEELNFISVRGCQLQRFKKIYYIYSCDPVFESRFIWESIWFSGLRVKFVHTYCSEFFGSFLKALFPSKQIGNFFEKKIHSNKINKVSFKLEVNFYKFIRRKFNSD